MNWETFLSNQLDSQKRRELWRFRNIINKNDARTIIFDKRQYINFSSNDYLGLSHNTEIITAWKMGFSQYGAGSSSSGHITGYSCAHAELERQLSEWLGYPRALLFISGYAVNQSVIIALMRKDDHIIADKLSHASLLEASILSPARLHRFAHNDLETVQFLLGEHTTGKTLVITEGVFSMDGDSAPLGKLQVVVRNAHAWLLVDDAHGIGVIGHEGRGSCYVHQVQPDLLVITFSKAFGLSGAALLCHEDTANYFLQYSRHLIYSTSMPPAQAVALTEAVKQIRHGDNLRERLQRNINYFLQLVNHYNIPFLKSYSAIQLLMLGSNQRAVKLSQYLRQKGFWVQSIRPPTVPVGTARLRITLMASHKLHDISHLMEVLNKCFNNYSNE